MFAFWIGVLAGIFATTGMILIVEIARTIGNAPRIREDRRIFTTREPLPADLNDWFEGGDPPPHPF